MKEKSQRLKPEWVKTNIPEDIKVEFHWKAFIGTSTFTTWRSAMVKMPWSKENQKYYRISRDTYNQLREELHGMPEMLVMKLPEDLKVWICGIRGIAVETASVSVDDTTKAHDVGIFRNLDSIMNESDLLSFYEGMKEQHICYSSQLSKIQGFIWQYAMESNKYVIEELRSLADELCDQLNELLRFGETTFSPYPDKKDGADIKWGFHLDLKGIDQASVTEGDEELEARMDWLIISYKKYREAVRSNLIV